MITNTEVLAECDALRNLIQEAADLFLKTVLLQAELLKKAETLATITRRLIEDGYPW